MSEEHLVPNEVPLSTETDTVATVKCKECDFERRFTRRIRNASPKARASNSGGGHKSNTGHEYEVYVDEYV